MNILLIFSFFLVYGEGSSSDFSFYVAISAKNLNFKNF